MIEEPIIFCFDEEMIKTALEANGWVIFASMCTIPSFREDT